MRYIQYTTIVSTGYNLYPYLNININNANASTVPEAAVSQIYPVFIIECQTMVVAKARKQGCSYDREGSVINWGYALYGHLLLIKGNKVIKTKQTNKQTMLF